MANPFSGEVAVWIDGRRHVAKLTLGALAALEGELGADSLIGLVERFEGGRFATRDVIAVLVAGLRGGGWPGEAETLMTRRPARRPGRRCAHRGRAAGARVPGRGMTERGLDAGLDWGGLMRAGLVGLRLTPAQFWALTPAELALMLGIEAGAGGQMTRDRLAQLAARFPD